MAHKNFILDTNVLINDPDCIYKFEENGVHIPMEVVEELDSNKTANGMKGYHCRKALTNLLKESENPNSKINFVRKYGFADNLLGIDDCIVASAQLLNKENKIVLSNDKTVRLKCKLSGINSEEYKNLPDKQLNDMIAGENTIVVPDSLIDLFYEAKHIDISHLSIVEKPELLQNSFVVLKSELREKKCGVGIVKGDLIRKLSYDQIKPAGLKPRNLEQKMAIELLMDKDIDLVTLTGTYGTSKTLLALACALEQQAANPNFRKILLAKAPISLDKNLQTGFKPGTIDDKYMDVMGSISHNLKVLSPNSDLNGRELLKEYILLGLIEIISLEDILGSSFNNSIIILDEAQLLTKDNILAIISRVGENSKIMITGDLKQHAMNNLTPESTGLFHLVNSLSASDLTGHLTLKETQRSRLVNLLSEKW